MQTGKKTFSDEERESILSNSRLDKDLNYKERGEEITLKGIETTMGEDCYVIARISTKGDESTEFYAQVRGYLSK